MCSTLQIISYLSQHILIISILLLQISYTLNTSTTTIQPINTESTIFYTPSTIYPSPTTFQCNSIPNPIFPYIQYNKTLSINNSNSNTQYIGMKFTCPSTNHQGCYYGCFQHGSCINSIISCNNNIGCNIQCNGSYSCASMTITSLIQSNTITIICNQQFACNDMKINAIAVKELNIHCTHINSCNGMNIIINNTDTISTVFCYDMNTCDNMYFYSTFAHAKSTLVMYEYSRDIILHNIYKMQCQGTPNSTYDSSEVMINTNTKSSNTVFLWVICLIVVIASIAMISAWIYIWYPKAIVDNSKFCVPIIISLQIINLWSDINLCIEIFYKSWYQNNIFIILLGVGIIVFIFISYLINIILSKQIKSIICTNIACKYYFESKIIQPNSNNYFTNNNRYILFIFIMIITGSSWCSLLFLSSKLFGLDILNNGLTNYDLNQLLAGKKSYYFICSHTIFYNLPQILFQCLYCIVIKQITLYNAIAFVTSIITLIVFTFYYILEKQKMSFYQTIEYYVEMDAVSKREFDKNDHYIFHYQHQIMANKGKNAALLKNIKTVFGHDNDHNMEIGYTALTTYGCITHFISRIDVNDIGPRYLKESEIKNLNESEMSTFHSLLNDGPNDKNINKKIATKYVYNLFISNMDHITEVFRIHYGIDIHIKIIYHNTYPINNNDKIYHNKLQFIELYNTSLIINKRRQITKSPTSSFKKPKSPFKKARSPFKASTLSPRRIINYSPHISKTKSNDSKDNTTTRVRRTQSNPLENGAVFTIDGAKNNNIPHVRLVESDDDQNGKDIYSPAADSSETDPFNESEGRQLRRKVSDTLDENIDYTGLCVESPNNKAIKNSPRSFVGISHLALGMGRRSFSGNNPLGLNVRSKSLNHTEFGTGKSNIRILWRYDGWPEAKIVHAYKFNQNQNGMNVKEIIQQIISNDHDNEIEYEQLRYATNPTYLHGKRGWKVAYKDSFVPFLIGEDGVHEVDIWFRTKGFIHNGVGKQLK